MEQERTMNMLKNITKRRQILTLLIALCMIATAFTVPVSYAGEKELKQSTVTNGSLAKNGISAAQRLKKYKDNDFYSVPYTTYGENLMVFFHETSGRNVWFSMKYGDADSLCWNDKVKGKITGNKIKFTVKNWYTIVADANAPGGAKQIRIPTKISGTITLINNKKIKIKVTSRHDSNASLKEQYPLNKLKKGKKTTLKRSDTIPGLPYN